MTKLTTPSLFPPPGAIRDPLPQETVNIAQQLLTEVLVVVFENDNRPSKNQLVPKGEGELHE